MDVGVYIYVNKTDLNKFFEINLTVTTRINPALRLITYTGCDCMIILRVILSACHCH